MTEDVLERFLFLEDDLATITKINDDCWMWKVGNRGGSETTSFAAQQAAEKAMGLKA